MHLHLLAHNVRSLWNVGSFFRTCDAFVVERLYLTGYTGHPPRKEITKTALGAEGFVVWEHHKDPIPIIKELKKDGGQIVALEQTTDAIPLQKFPLLRRAPPPACPSELQQSGEGEDKGGGVSILLIVGHELQGVPGNILSLCDAIVEIPMLGKKESLNVAVATGIALWHLRYDSIVK